MTASLPPPRPRNLRVLALIASLAAMAPGDLLISASCALVVPNSYMCRLAASAYSPTVVDP